MFVTPKSNTLQVIFSIIFTLTLTKTINAQYSNYNSFNNHFQYQQRYYQHQNHHRNQAELEQLKEKYCEMPDFYELYGVTRDFTDKDLKRQWKLLSRETHPDKNTDKEDSEKQFQIVQEAYQVLKDDEARQKYDRVKEIYCVHYKPKRKPGEKRSENDSVVTQFGFFFDETDKTLSDNFDNDDVEMKFAEMFPGIRENEKLYLAALVRIMMNFTRYFMYLKVAFAFAERNMIHKGTPM